MGSLLNNRGLLITAWIVVLAFFGGALALALLQPPPAPANPEPVVVALDFGSPQQEPAAAEPSGDNGMAGETESPENGQEPDSQAADAAAKSGAEEGATETEHAAAVPLPPEASAPEEPAPEEPAPEEPAPEEPTQEAAADHETPVESPESHETAPPEPPAPAAAEVKAPLPEPAPEEHMTEGHAAESPMAEPEEGEKPAAQAQVAEPQAAAEEMQATEGHATAPEGTEGHGAGTEQTVNIPVIPPAPEQLPAWERYRQPFNMDDKRPRIAVVLTGLGLSDSATEAAINKLPSAVTLSFSPYARGLERWIALARSRGHEVMIDLPMEPATFPNEDPGPQALLTNLTPEENLDRLDWVLSRGSAYVGVAGSMGSRFTASRRDMEPVLHDVKSRGLMFLDRRTTENSVALDLAREMGLPAAVNNRSIDERQASRVAIDARLAQIERIALTDGYAVAMAQPYPVTLDRLADWATELTARGFVMAPITALANRQTLP